MSRRRLSVRTIREVLRLRRVSGLSTCEIAESCQISQSVVRSSKSCFADLGNSTRPPVEQEFKLALASVHLWPLTSVTSASCRSKEEHW